jgi:hypothetical protein
MAAEIRWVSEEDSGRLLFRRRYPADVRKALGWELKVPLGAKRRMTEASSKIYWRAVERFDREVRQARAATRLEQAKAAAAFDRLTPTQIDYLGSVFVHDRRTGMDQRVQEGHARTLGEVWGHILPAIREARVSSNAEALEAIFGSATDALLASEGLRLDPADARGQARRFRRGAASGALQGRAVGSAPGA